MNPEKMNFIEKSTERKESNKEELTQYAEVAESRAIEKIKTVKDETLKRKMLRKIAVWSVLTMIAVGTGEAKAQDKGPAVHGQRTETIKDNEQKLKKELRDNEHILPDAVLMAFHQVVDKNTPAEVGGAYIYKNFLDTKEKENKFRSLLEKESFTDEQIDTFNTYLTAEKGIVMNESDAVDKEKFNEVLLHERIHEAMHNLDRKGLDSLKAAYEDVINHPGIKKYNKLFDNYYEESFLWDNEHGFYAAFATMNWDEFYPYLANGKFLPRVEEEMKKAHPGAHKIFKEMETEARVTESK